jgi:hypothetical protein
MAEDFRQRAREALRRAKNELSSTDPERMRYAALELRFAMEAVTYDRALERQLLGRGYGRWAPIQCSRLPI